jgi:hypothetical protein
MLYPELDYIFDVMKYEFSVITFNSYLDFLSLNICFL